MPLLSSHDLYFPNHPFLLAISLNLTLSSNSTPIKSIKSLWFYPSHPHPFPPLCLISPYDNPLSHPFNPCTFTPAPSHLYFLCLNTVFPVSSHLLYPPPPDHHRSYQVWATVKRRLCRMLLLTISFRKRRGELLGDSLGDVAPLFPPTTPGILGGSSSRCMCSLNVRMQESISTLSSLDDIPAG